MASTISSTNLLLLKREFLRHYYNQTLDAEYETKCTCIQNNSTKIQPPTQPRALRVSNILTSQRLGGRTTFGSNRINQQELTHLGGREGQPGGLPRAPRNRF